MSKSPASRGRGRGTKRSSSGHSATASSPQATSERGLRPPGRNQGGSNQSITTASNGDDDIKMWLNELKQQIEKNEYNEKAFDKKTNGNVESAKVAVILKEICNLIRSQSQCKRDLRSKREILYSMLHEACDDLPSDSPEGTTSLVVKGAGARKQEFPEESQISTAIVNAEKLIKMVSATRGTKGINKKAVQQKQERQKQDELQRAEQQWKSKFSDVTEWLKKLVKQIDNSKYDEKDFTKSKNITGSHEEVNKCNTIILDCCRKLKNENDSKTSIETEVASLLEDIKAWGDTKPPKKANVNTCQVVESLRDSRLKLRERILEFKSIETEVASLLENITAWDDTKPPKKANGNASTVVEALRDSRSKLHERKLEFKSANKEVNLLLKEIINWDDVKTIHESKEDCKDTVVKEFREGRLQVHKWKKEFKSAKQEVDCLTKEIKAWVEVKVIDGEIDSDCELARLIRLNRFTIFEKKKELQSKKEKKEEKEKKEDTRKLTKKQEQAITDILTIIYKDKNTSGKVDIANYLDKIKQHVSVTRENLDEIETEVNSLLEEINAWDDTTPLKEANGNACKVVEALRESRLKLHKRKLDSKSGQNKKDVVQKEKQSQDQVIIEIWTMIGSTSVKVNSGEDDIGKLLKEIKKYVSDAQIRLVELNEIETEVNCLLEDIKRWDDTKPLNKANNNIVMIALRESRSKLRERILEFKSGQHDKEELARNEKQSQEQVIMIQEILTNIGPTSGKVISGGDEIRTGLTVIKKYVSNAQGRLAEFNKIEKPLFDVEERSNLLFSDLTGTHHSKSDEQRSPVDTCKSILKILDNCKTETDTFVEIVLRLEGDLNIDRKSDSVSNRCKAIKEIVEKRKQMFDEMQSMLDKSTHSLTLSYSELLDEPYLFLEPRTNADSLRRKVPEWLHDHAALIDRICACTKENRKSFQLRKEAYNDLQDQMRTLRVEMRQLREDKESAYNRLSKVAGARLTDNNPNIADLSDPNRPTKIAEHYSELYDTPWTDAFETLKNKDQENTDFLLKIIVNCYDICGNISKNHQRNLKNAVCYPADNIENGQASKQKRGTKKNPVSFSAVQSKALSELRKQTADISVDDVISQIESVHKEWFGPKKLGSYTTRCIELCWLMHVQTPPVVIDTCAKPGSSFDTSRYKQYTKAGKKIDFVVWPVLLLEEGGAILCKGVAQGK